MSIDKHVEALVAALKKVAHEKAEEVIKGLCQKLHVDPNKISSIIKSEAALPTEQNSTDGWQIKVHKYRGLRLVRDQRQRELEQRPRQAVRDAGGGAGSRARSDRRAQCSR
jgi:hypothetical protein